MAKINGNEILFSSHISILDPVITQEPGYSEAHVMSQKAVTDLFPTVQPLEGEQWEHYAFMYPEDGYVGYTESANRTRLAIKKIHKFPYKVHLSVKDGYRFNVAYLSSGIPSTDTFISGESWRTEPLTIEAGQYFSLVIAKSVQAEITPEEAENFSMVGYVNVENFLNDRIADVLTAKVNPIEKEQWEHYAFMYPEDGYVGYTESANRTRLAIKKIHKFPYKVHLSVKDGYRFNVAYLSSGIPSTDTFISGESWRTEPLTIEAGQYFSLVIAKSVQAEITPEEAENFSMVGYITIANIYSEMNTGTDDIIARNKDIERIVQACTNVGRSGERYKKGLSMLAATDIHGDASALKNMIKYLDHTPGIDCGISLGDMQVITYGENDGTWYTDVVKQSNKDFYTVLGNHDIGVWNGYEGNGTADLSFDKFIKPTLDKIGILDLATPYYSKTFDSYKTVVIVLNTYDAPNDTDASGEFIVSRDNEMFSQAQIDWFIQALASVPSGYHVVIAMHSVGFDHTIVESNFTQKNDTYNLEMNYPYGHCTIVPDIINAWKNGSALTDSYAPVRYADVLQPLTVNCDFSERGAGEFVCYLVGHNHSDMIMKCAKYEDQNIISLASSSGTVRCVERADLPRISGTKSEDVLTVFSVDTNHRSIKLVRVGSNMSCNMVDRTYTAINY